MSSKRTKQKTVASRKPPRNGRPRYYSAMNLSKLKPYKKNPRQNEEAVEAVVKSIEQFGKIAPIIVNEKLQICAGHTRFKAALERNEKTFPTLIVPGLTGERFRAYNIADNQTALIAQWDTQGLAEIIKELQDEGFPTETLGFAEDRLDEILASLEDGFKGETDPDDVLEPPKRAITKTGDLWLLGDHRLLCGDSTKAEDVERLLDGAKPLLMVTDPPYGVNYDPEWRNEAANHGKIGHAARRVGRVPNDDRVDWSDAYRLFPGDIAYTWSPGGDHVILTGLAIQSIGFNIRYQIIWAKPRFAIGRGHYNWQHEPCWYAVRKGVTVNWIGDHSQTTLWDISNVLTENEGKTNHGTQKPFECMARPIRNHDAPEVYDPFLGSGTTMIAAERLGRKCYGIEIEPIYVDISVRRWQNFTGKKATLIRNGKQSKITMLVMEGVSA